jgi:hypothetical protein
MQEFQFNFDILTLLCYNCTKGELKMETTKSKRATIYFSTSLHKALKMKALETETSISELVNLSIIQMLQEDEDDLNSFNERINEPTIKYENLLSELKRDGKI